MKENYNMHIYRMYCKAVNPRTSLIYPCSSWKVGNRDYNFRGG